MCQFSYYKDEKDLFPQLYCHLRDNEIGGYCMYRKRCDDQQKFILLEERYWKDCNIMNEYIIKKDIPDGANKVVSVNVRKNGKVVLYVKTDNGVIKVDSPNNEELDYVFLEKVKDNYVAYTEKPKTEKYTVVTTVTTPKKYNGKKKN